MDITIKTTKEIEEYSNLEGNTLDIDVYDYDKYYGNIHYNKVTVKWKTKNCFAIDKCVKIRIFYNKKGKDGTVEKTDDTQSYEKLEFKKGSMKGSPIDCDTNITYKDVDVFYWRRGNHPSNDSDR